jgi:hypothetical protein
MTARNDVETILARNIAGELKFIVDYEANRTLIIYEMLI